MPNQHIEQQAPFPPVARSPWLRPKTIAITLILAVLAGLGYWVFSIATLVPGKPGKFTAAMNQLVADAQADTLGKPNAWESFAAACDLYQRSSQAYLQSPKPAKLPEGWPEEFGWPLSPEAIADPNVTGPARQQLIDIIKQFDDAGVNAKLDEVAAGSRFIRELPADTKSIEILLPELGQARGIARLCKGRMFLAAEAGNGPEFVRAARHALVIGDLLKKQATMIDQLVGVAIDALVSGCIREAIVRGQLSPDTCRGLLALYQGRASTLDVDRALRSEHLGIQDTVEWTHSDDGNGDGLFIGGELLTAATSGTPNSKPLPKSLTNFGSLVVPSKAQTLATFEELFAKTRVYAALPLRQRLTAELPDSTVDRLSKRQVVVRLLFPAFGRYIELSEQADLTAAGTKIMLALEIHRAAKGAYPSSLMQLEPSLKSLGVKELWINELRYKVLAPGADPDGRGYLLYWIGIDNVDNDGRIDEKGGSHTAWQRSSAGFDYVMNEPLPKAKPKPAQPAAGAEPQPETADGTTIPAGGPQPAPK